MEIVRDSACRTFEITDYDGDESCVMYFQDEDSYSHFNGWKFLVISIVKDGKRINRLVISDVLLEELKIKAK